LETVLDDRAEYDFCDNGHERDGENTDSAHELMRRIVHYFSGGSIIDSARRAEPIGATRMKRTVTPQRRK
jgi:hypothetical protein